MPRGGVDPVGLEALVNHATLSVGDHISAPGLGSLATAIWDDAAAMIRAVKAGDKDQADKADQRLSAIRTLAPIGASDDVELRQITLLTGIGDDGLHRLVMDLHKALNRLAATCAQETLAGAHVYGLLPDDRPAIEAFMRGLEATKKLKFGHPGLATTATRTGKRLTIQNDIGETDAHVVVIAVELGAVSSPIPTCIWRAPSSLSGCSAIFPSCGADSNAKAPPVLATTAPSISSPDACRSTTSPTATPFSKSRRVTGVPYRLEQGAQDPPGVGLQE